MAYVKVNRKETVNLYLYALLLLFILQDIGNSEHRTNPIHNWIKIRKYGKASFFGFIYGPASYPNTLEHLGLVLELQVSPPTRSPHSFDKPLLPIPTSKHTSAVALLFPRLPLRPCHPYQSLWPSGHFSKVRFSRRLSLTIPAKMSASPSTSYLPSMLYLFFPLTIITI